MRMCSLLTYVQSLLRALRLAGGKVAVLETHCPAQVTRRWVRTPRCLNNEDICLGDS